MKVLFLDIDGVLNNNEFHEKRNKGELVAKYAIYNVLMNRLNEIIDKTKCEIVVSSSWRNGGQERVNRELLESGLTKEILDITGNHVDGDRGLEILAYIEQHNITDYVVVDDDMCGIQKTLENRRLAPTDWQYGLTEEVKERVISILNNEVVSEDIVCKCQLCFINKLKADRDNNN